jgi:predicted TIM-barrel fold metal-dependent hydrolase
MSTHSESKSMQIRARLSHPVIDSDGHAIEAMPVFLDYLKEAAGSSVADKFASAFHDTVIDPRWRSFSIEERRARRNLKPTWWANAARNTRDLATAVLPKLMHERLGELGLDFGVVYPTFALATIAIEDAEMRQACARAMNAMRADLFGEYSDRLTPAAVIPMHTPQEAIAELEYAVKRLGLKVAMVASYVRRPIPKVVREFPEAARYTYWMDTFGLDSEHDYDAFWAKCVELKISPTFHSVGYGWGSRTSISNYIYNHIGNFAASAEAVCKSLFIGGVPARFPGLTFGFLEGGAAWARTLYCELISHWEKRNREALENYNPANIDRAGLAKLITRYGGKTMAGRATGISESIDAPIRGGADPSQLDEWAQSAVRSAEDIRDIFTERFYFGCEGDDPLTMLAFRPMGTRFNAQLRAFYGSDIGHWDVPDMSRILDEAYELVEHGLMSSDELRDFVFATPVRFWTSTNPDFFKGTQVESDVARLVGGNI